ncbi:MAG: fatty acyl-CoA reductase [Alcanivorax sp.]|nr:fatty acyl-CoA reductase [Alcanivorax sp.]
MPRKFPLRMPDLRPNARELAGTLVRRLDATLFPAFNLRRRVAGKTVLITGASMGIGETLAYRLAQAGAHVLLSARSTETLEQVASRIRDHGGKVDIYPCDIANMEDCDRMAAEVLSEHARVDILVNNAGRSIRRPVAHSLDRFHDFERTMQLNYFGAIRLTMALLPRMREQGGAQVINISTLGVQTLPARFSAYLASKGALEMWTQVAGNELSHEGIHFSLVNYPLVRTPMIAPTEIYRYTPALTPAQAVDWICQAIITRQKRVAGLPAYVATAMYMGLPKLSESIVNTLFQMTPESRASRGMPPRRDVPDYRDNVQPLRRRRSRSER